MGAGCVAGKAIRCHISGSLFIGLPVTPAGRRIPLLGARTGPRRNASCCRGTLSLSLSLLYISYLCHTFCSLFIGLPVTPPTPTPLPPRAPPSLAPVTLPALSLWGILCHLADALVVLPSAPARTRKAAKHAALSPLSSTLTCALEPRRRLGVGGGGDPFPRGAPGEAQSPPPEAADGGQCLTNGGVAVRVQEAAVAPASLAARQLKAPSSPVRSPRLPLPRALTTHVQSAAR